MHAQRKQTLIAFKYVNITIHIIKNKSEYCMSSTRTNEAPVEEKIPESPWSHIRCSFMATLVCQPIRACLNRASMYRDYKFYEAPFVTIADSRPYLWAGLPLNLLRGSLATGSQSYMKHWAQSWGGFYWSVSAAAVSGATVATFVETHYIRKTLGVSGPLFLFSPSLSAMYLLREIGFTLTVLSKKDMSPLQQNAVLLTSTWVTAIAHKFASIYATRDTLPKEVTIPEFRQGVRYTINAMARGDVYTHPAFQVPIKNPSNLKDLARNLMSVTCGANMFIFRLTYLLVFREVYNLVKESETSVFKWMGLFPDKKTIPTKSPEVQETKGHRHS